MIILFALLVLLIIVLLLARYTYHEAFYSPPQKRASPFDPISGEQYVAVSDRILSASKKLDAIQFEEVWITSKDGLRLYGRYYHLADGAPLQILFHGYRSCALRDCSGGYLLAHKLGFNVLIVDQRAHGKSGGHTITFGIKERFDCLCWVEYACSRFGTEAPIVLSGLSMGAATVLMATELDLPDNVVCVIADSPYSAPSDIIRKVCLDRRYPVKPAYLFLALGALVFGKFNMEQCSAAEAVKYSRLPILLLHGEDDRLVPYQMSRYIQSVSASYTILETFPNSGHGLCYVIDPSRYEKVVSAFLKSVPALGVFLKDISD